MGVRIIRTFLELVRKMFVFERIEGGLLYRVLVILYGEEHERLVVGGQSEFSW